MNAQDIATIRSALLEEKLQIAKRKYAKTDAHLIAKLADIDHALAALDGLAQAEPQWEAQLAEALKRNEADRQRDVEYCRNHADHTIVSELLIRIEDLQAQLAEGVTADDTFYLDEHGKLQRSSNA